MVRCKKDVPHFENRNIILYIAGNKYESKIIGDDFLAKDEFGDFGLIGVCGEQCQTLGLLTSLNGWDSWFNDHFEIIP